MTYYNPFNKDISQLEKEDLDKLIDKVAEGWFVEYKGDFQTPKKISHSIASFANSDGGWYIVGIDGEKGTNLAKKIVPFDLNKHSEPKDKVRNIIVNGINPTPFFESKLIKISNNKAVLVMYIGRGDQTPYVTNDGKIYKRQGEASDPIALRDHYSIQQLYDRSKEAKLLIETFSENQFGISEAQYDEKQCFLEVYLYTLPLNTFTFDDFQSKDFFDKLIKNFSEQVEIFSQLFTASVKLNNFYSSLDSYILRQTNSDNSIDRVGTLELFYNGNMKIMFPIPTLSTENWENMREDYFPNYENFYNALSKTEKDFLKIIDGNDFFVVFMTFFNQYIRLLKKRNYSEEIGVRFRIINSWRTLLFFNDETYIDSIKKHGSPICLKSEIEIPEFDRGNLLRYSLEENKITVPLEDLNLEADLEINPIFMISLLFESLGISKQTFMELFGGIGGHIGSRSFQKNE